MCQATNKHLQSSETTNLNNLCSPPLERKRSGMHNQQGEYALMIYIYKKERNRCLFSDRPQSAFSVSKGSV